MYYFVGLICFLTGLFKEFVIFSSIICIHELGHILVAIYFHWQIDKIILLPFGGITIFKESLNKPLNEEFCIAIAGPLFQIVFYWLLGRFHPLFSIYHYSILLFNLLPIVPLDGSKIIALFFYRFLPFKKTGYLILWISMGVIICLLGYGFLHRYNISLLLILGFLIVEICKQWRKQRYYFHKFLLERYLYSFTFKKEKIIKRIEEMQREKKHLFQVGNFYHTEKEILHKMFDK